MPVRYSFSLKVALAVLIIYFGMMVLSFPGRSYHYIPGESNADSGFSVSGLEAPTAYPSVANQLTQNSEIQYRFAPRYSPLDLRLKLQFSNAAQKPLRLEIYEMTVTPSDNQAQLIATLTNVTIHNPEEYTFTVPARTGGEGLKLQFRLLDNAAGSNIKLLETNLSLPPTHFLSLFWPNPYWPAALILLAAMSAWMLRLGLGFPQTLVFCGLQAFVIVTMSASSFWNCWWMLLTAIAIWAFYCWEGYLLKAGKESSLWPLLGATTLLVFFFLFSQDYYYEDIEYYFHWGQQVQANGIWNVYDYSFAVDPVTPLSYLPLIVYVLQIYRWIVAPFVLGESVYAWRILCSLMFLAVIIFLYLIGKTAREEEDKENHKPQSSSFLSLLAFNAAFFYNPVIWGQTEVLGLLPLVTTMYLLLKKRPYAAGLSFGMVLISKPQAWFIAPLLGWMLLQRFGRYKGLIALSIAVLVTIVLGTFAFGFDSVAINTYFRQPEFTGNYHNELAAAFNLNYLVMGKEVMELPAWLSLAGFVVVCLVCVWVLKTISGRNQTLSRYSEGAALLGLSCFTFLIKMKERYLIFGIPFLGLAAIRNPRFLWPLLLLSWLQLLNLTSSLFLYNHAPYHRNLNDSFYLWSILLGEDWMGYLLSSSTILLFGWLAYLYWQEVRTRVVLPQIEEYASEEAVRQPV
ncbi:MAG TPA: hypothetical protein VH186_25640 [Chloroflexia bacterium]|nr:hypothetical protein [Chloroflexia bacterium]